MFDRLTASASVTVDPAPSETDATASLPAPLATPGFQPPAPNTAADTYGPISGLALNG